MCRPEEQHRLVLWMLQGEVKCLCEHPYNLVNADQSNHLALML